MWDRGFFAFQTERRPTNLALPPSVALRRPAARFGSGCSACEPRPKRGLGSSLPVGPSASPHSLRLSVAYVSTRPDGTYCWSDEWTRAPGCGWHDREQTRGPSRASRYPETGDPRSSVLAHIGTLTAQLDKVKSARSGRVGVQYVPISPTVHTYTKSVPKWTTRRLSSVQGDTTSEMVKRLLIATTRVQSGRTFT